jgi:hypothetical protein
LLLEIKRLPNASFMLIRDRLGAPNDTIVLDARALSAIDRARFGNLPGDEAFGSDAPAEADASIELVPTPEGEAAAGICGHPLVCRAGADAGQAASRATESIPMQITRGSYGAWAVIAADRTERPLRVASRLRPRDREGPVMALLRPQTIWRSCRLSVAKGTPLPPLRRIAASIRREPDSSPTVRRP